MLPTYLLPKISPHACKLYFVLLAHLKPGKDAPIATVSMNSLAADSALSPRTCCRALTELCDLALLRRLPFAYHQIHSYLFLPIPDPPAQATHTASPPQATHPVSPVPASPPQATLLNPSPSNSQASPPQATLLNTPPHPAASPTLAALLDLADTAIPAHAGRITPEFLRTLAAKVAPEKRPKILAVAAELERLLQTAGPAPA